MSRTYSHSPFMFLGNYRTSDHTSQARKCAAKAVNHQDRRLTKKVIQDIIRNPGYEEEAVFDTNQKTVNWNIW